MAWSVLQSASNGNANFGPPLTATYGTNLSSGTTMLAFVCAFQQTTTSVADASSNAFTKLASAGLNGSTANGELSLWSLDTPAGDVGTKPVITGTVTSTGSCSILIQEVSGLGATASQPDGTAGATGGTASGTIGPPSYTSGTAGEYLLYLYGDSGDGATWTAPSGYSSDPNSSNASFACDLAVCYKNSTGGTETGTYSINAGGTWELLMVALKLSGPVVTSGPALPQQYPARRPAIVVSNAGWRGGQHSR